MFALSSVCSYLCDLIYVFHCAFICALSSVCSKICVLAYLCALSCVCSDVCVCVLSYVSPLIMFALNCAFSYVCVCALIRVLAITYVRMCFHICVLSYDSYMFG